MASMIKRSGRYYVVGDRSHAVYHCTAARLNSVASKHNLVVSRKLRPMGSILAKKKGGKEIWLGLPDNKDLQEIGEIIFILQGLQGHKKTRYLRSLGL